VACIWSCPTEQMLRFPMATMIRFCHNHGLLQVANRPQWFTVTGGSREYVRKVLARLKDTRLATPVTHVTRHAQGVTVHTAQGPETFDGVVMACHSDQALRLLGAQATANERDLLGAIRYQPNRAVLHTDTRLLPQKRSAWAAWNYERAIQRSEEHTSELQSRENLVCRLLLEKKNQVNPLADLGPGDIARRDVRQRHEGRAGIAHVGQADRVPGAFEVRHLALKFGLDVEHDGG